MSGLVKTWRERIGAGPSFPLDVPTDVERAMVAEIADLRAAAHVQALPAAGDSWVVLGGQRFNKQALLDLQQDAGRYRWLRDKADGMAGVAAPMVASLDAAGRVIDFLDGEDLDAVVDAAMTLRPERRALNKKRMGA